MSSTVKKIITVGIEWFSIRCSFGKYNGGDDRGRARQEKNIRLFITWIGRPQTSFEFVWFKPFLRLNVKPHGNVT